MNFRSFLIVYVAAVGALAKPDKFPPQEVFEIIDPLHELCTHKMGVSDAEVKNYDIKDNSPKMMCYMECLLKESKWMSEDGSIRFDFIREYVHPSVKQVVVTALDKCLVIEPGTKPCEKSYNFNVCMQAADPEHYFLI